MKINAKTFAGIGVGLLAGYFLFKTKNNRLHIFQRKDAKTNNVQTEELIDRLTKIYRNNMKLAS